MVRNLFSEVEASNFLTWGGLRPFLWSPLILGIIARPTNFEKPYLHFQRSDFHKFDIKLFRKERPFKQKKHFIIETKFGG